MTGLSLGNVARTAIVMKMKVRILKIPPLKLPIRLLL
ncbi:hypothetical protein ES703_58182 [subsurface metagenome]